MISVISNQCINISSLMDAFCSSPVRPAADLLLISFPLVDLTVMT